MDVKNSDLDSIGSRSVPYFVLLDGTEVDLHVDHCVPYLFDDGDVTIHRAAYSFEFPNAVRVFNPLLRIWCARVHIWRGLHLTF